MQKAIVFALLALVLPGAAQSQNCPWGSVYFTSQDEVNNFKATYPGCTRIDGDVWIASSTVSNLDSLHEITTISGSLYLGGNIWLQNLDGLSNLDSLGGSLTIGGNEQLHSISGIAKLTAVGDGFSLSANQSLTSLDGIQNIATIGGDFMLSYQGAVTDFSPLNNLTSIGGGFRIELLPQLTDLTPFSKLQKIGGEMLVFSNYALTSFDGLQGIDSLQQGCWIYYCPNLVSLNGLNNVQYVGQSFTIESCEKLASLNGLNALNTTAFNFSLKQNAALADLSALGNLTAVGGNFSVTQNPALTSLSGLENLAMLGSDVEIVENPTLADLSALGGITRTNGSVSIISNGQLSSLNGLQNLDSVGGYLSIASNPGLVGLVGLEQLKWVGITLQIFQNDALTDISALGNLRKVGYSIEIYQNPLLTNCAVAGVCRHLVLSPDKIFIQSNGPGCNDPAEVVGQCVLTPVAVRVLTDPDGNCLSDDPAAHPAIDATVLLAGVAQSELRPCPDDGRTYFQCIDQTQFSLSVQQFSAENWEVCQNNQTFDPGAVPAGDTVRATFLLKPLRQCAELEVRLGLPADFREDCSVQSEVSVSTKNIGTTEALGAIAAVVLPPSVELVQSDPVLTTQTGDTLFFEIGNLLPFATATVKMTVRSKCSGVVPGQSFCWEVYATAANTCPTSPPTASEINVSATCAGDSVVFVLKNIGGAPTQNLHTFKIIKNKYVQRTDTFSLAPQETLTVRVPADGSTWRMEATKRDDGSRTATFFEGCGGLTPGLVSAFWLEKGAVSHDFDCRQVVASPSSLLPRLTATPTGVGATYLLAPGQPVQYTLEFQNPDSDTAHVVVLRTAFQPGLNPATFRPVAASHPFEWVIRSGNELELTFPGIDLPDSLTNLAGSRGFFTFSIEQTPGLATGTTIVSDLFVQFDNGPLVQSVIWHTIGEPLPKGLTCAPGGITFYDQFQVDRFQADYPGCVKILGPVGLQYTQIENLNALNEVEYMGSFFADENLLLSDISGLQNLDSCAGMFISNNPALKNLHGLEKLKRVGDYLVITESPTMESLTGLENLQSVGGNLTLGAGGISDLIPLGNLTTVGGDFQPGGGPNLLNLLGLEQLTAVGGTLDLGYSRLVSLDGVENLRTIGGDLRLWENDQLTSIAALEKLKTIGGSLVVETTALPDLNGLDSLESIGGDILVLTNPYLSELNGLNQLKKLGSNIWIKENPELFLLNGLNNLDSVPGDVEIIQNPVLYETYGLNHLRSVGGDFSFGGNHLLVTVAGLDSLRYVGGGFAIADNDNLNYFNGFHNLTATGGSFYIYDNPKLIDLYGFEQLDSVGGSVLFAQNLTLTNLQDMRSLWHVGGDFSMVHNPKLVDIDSLRNVRAIGGFLLIEGNDALTDLNGFANLDSIGGNLSILSNASLATLNGLQLLQKIPGGLFINENHSLLSVDGLNNVSSVGAEMNFYNNTALESLNGLNKLKTIGSDMIFRYNAKLKNFAGLEKLESVGGNFWVGNHDALESFAGLDSLKTIGKLLTIDYNYGLKTLTGLTGLTSIGESIFVGPYNGITSLAGLDNLAFVNNHIAIFDNYFLTELNSLNNLVTVQGEVSITNNRVLKRLNGFENLQSIGAAFFIQQNKSLASLDDFKNLTTVGGALLLLENDSLPNLSGLEQLASIGESLVIGKNPLLTTVNGLEGLQSIGGIPVIYNNAVLMDLYGLSNLQTIGTGNLEIVNNPMLSECSVPAVCNFLSSMVGTASIYDNAPGCDTPGEVEAYCNSTPVRVEVLLDNNADCLPDAADSPVGDVQIHLDGSIQMSTRPSGTTGVAHFKFLENGPFSLSLPQFPTANWEACTALISLSPGPLPQDTVRATFLLRPLNQCPELTTRLELPSVFRGCLVQSDVWIFAQNTGASPAEGVKMAVVVPPVFDVLATDPAASGQNGDTLYFDAGDLDPFEKALVKLTVKTSCDTFLFGHTLCWEAFANMGNACPHTLPAFSEIKLAAQCLADTAVRFTLKNIGDAPTQGPHDYRIIRNAETYETGAFSLVNQESMAVDVPADGATWRMEATKLDNGARTAVALENCNGLTTGQINAFWLEQGPAEYDFACREVIGAFDPNQKTAVPTGAGPDRILEANVPLRYTIDFQNTGTDTAFRVLLRDVLPAGLDIASFRSGLSSHPNTWQIRGADTLEVLFFPIMLPDSNVNEPASHGFFTFEISQLPDLPIGTVLDNTASIIFDFNPPIVTNTVLHRIGRLTVRVDAPQPHAMLWRVLGNPTRDAATFLATSEIAGEKRFELFDAAGRSVRTEQFSGQSFEFRRDGLPAGWYIFRIEDALGRVFSGKIVVVE
jgi:hypothetical protein